MLCMITCKHVHVHHLGIQAITEVIIAMKSTKIKKKKPPWKVALLVSDKKYDDMEKWKDHNYFSSKTMQWVEITDKENFLDFTLLAGTAPHFNLTAFLK